MPSTLTPGDIALVGYSSDTGGKSFAFVILKDLAPGTVIFFTDNGWFASGGFRSGEGVVSYTVPAAGVTAGTVISITGLTGTLNPSTSGDQIIAFTGSLAAPTPIFALDFADGNSTWAADATNSNTSAVPSGLNAGVTALAFPLDNAAYTGPVTGSQAQILANIANPANWTSNDNTPVNYPASFSVLAGGNAAVSISDVTVTEGDAGQTIMTFTVTRSDTTGAFTVDYSTADGTATAGTDYQAASGTLSFVAGGPASHTVSVVINADGAPEPNETLFLNLSNAVASSGTATIIDAQGQGTIANDDFPHLAIYEIQGAGHTSAWEGQQVITQGVVTAIDTTGGKGFWIQDPNGDGNDATSDAVFVFTSNLSGVHVGDLVQVNGTVTEFRGSDPNNLTVTEITSPTYSVIGTGTVEATVIGEGGRHVPTEVIDSDNFGTFNPDHDAIDFFESLEGMLVTVHDAQATAPNDGNSVWVLPDAGAGSTGENDRGGVTISDGDYNPEHIQVFADSGVLPGFVPHYSMGESLGDVTGIMHYFGGQYELVPTSVENANGAAPVLPDEVTSLQGDRAHLEVASYNLENIDPNDPTSKFEALGHDIAVNLGSPDIIGLEEIQDADGTGRGTDYSGAATAQLLIDAIVAAGGPRYVYVEIAPTANNTTGGESNGNIRCGFLYNPDRVDYVDGSAHLIPDTDPTNGNAFNNSRMPLAADFVFHGETVSVIDIHNYSRGGSDESFGQTQPAGISGEQRREDQTHAVVDYLDDVFAANPDAHVVVTGDFNGFYFEQAQTQLETEGHLYNLTWTLTAEERYSYVFEGNAQQIDHMFVSASLTAHAQFDIVHLNTGQPGTTPTDHDPVLGLLYVNSAPVSAADAYFGMEDAVIAVDAFHGVLSNDTDRNDDAMIAVLQSGPAFGVLDFHSDGSFTYTPGADFNGSDSFVYVTYDEFGEASGAMAVLLGIAAVNDAPVAAADSASVHEDASVLIDVLANDHDVDGDALAIQLLGSTSTLGATVTVENGQIRYVADADAFDALSAGQSVTDTLSYRVSDGHGGWSDPVAVSVVVSEAGDNRSLTGTNKADVFTDASGFDTTYFGGNGDDYLVGGDGADVLWGENGKDVLVGGAGADILYGGAGDDVLTGGAGHDVFVVSTNGGRDVITDFNPDEDVILTGGGSGGPALRFREVDTDGDHKVDSVEIDGPGMGKVVLSGWTLQSLIDHHHLSAQHEVIGDWLHG